jgi:DNA-binding FadR family transcriptional regulator
LSDKRAGFFGGGSKSKECDGPIPPENVLTHEFRASRFTIRQALDLLKKEGSLRMAEGKKEEMESEA